MGRVTRGLGDAALRDRIGQATATYFTDWSHPGSGMARERSAGAFGYDVEDTVTTGGTGFGLLAQIVAAERGWRPRRDILDRLERLVGWLEAADRFDGVFPHFLSGATGRVIPFMRGDDGGDLVETAFLMMGLLAAGAYFTEAPEIGDRIDALYAAVNWTVHLRDGGLVWHHHPDRPRPAHALAIRGWNEALPVFVLAAGAPRHPVPASVYHESWATAAAFRNGRTYDGIRLPLGPDWGGPLFLSQYAFLVLDPSGLRDAYADYGEQVRAHALVNRAHCLANPGGWKGYGPACWGLTASDDPSGYVAHSPTRDTGTITPTAALGSFPLRSRRGDAGAAASPRRSRRPAVGRGRVRRRLLSHARLGRREPARHRPGPDRRRPRKPPLGAALAALHGAARGPGRPLGTRLHLALVHRDRMTPVRSAAHCVQRGQAIEIKYNV